MAMVYSDCSFIFTNRNYSRQNTVIIFYCKGTGSSNEGRIGSLNVVITGEFIWTPEEPLAGLILVTSGGTESTETIPSFAIGFSGAFSEALVPK